jgi:hypothetical protein
MTTRNGQTKIPSLLGGLDGSDGSPSRLRDGFARLRAQGQELRAQSLEAAQELRERAEGLRGDLRKKLEDAQRRMIALLGVASREEVEKLSRSIKKLSRQVDRRAP